MACISLPTLLYYFTGPQAGKVRCFGFVLSPVHYRRPASRRVSCYALFKWWLLLSQHPRCLGNQTSLCTEHELGTLAGGQGCFPFDHGGYPPQTHSRDSHRGIRSLDEGGRLVAPAFQSVALPPRCSCPEAAPRGISRRTRYLQV